MSGYFLFMCHFLGREFFVNTPHTQHTMVGESQYNHNELILLRMRLMRTEIKAFLEEQRRKIYSWHAQFSSQSKPQQPTKTSTLVVPVPNVPKRCKHHLQHQQSQLLRQQHYRRHDNYHKRNFHHPHRLPHR